MGGELCKAMLLPFPISIPMATREPGEKNKTKDTLKQGADTEKQVKSGKAIKEKNNK